MAPAARWAVATGIAVVALAWSGLLVATPRWRAQGGAAAVSAALVYAVGDRVCHQRPERSFAVAGTPLPVCARCSGLYLSGTLGALLGLAWSLSTRGRHSDTVTRWRGLLIASAVPTGLSWLAEVTTLAEPSMLVRALCAAPLGFVTGWICIRAATGALR
jgi:uncharacterized membrane protein